MDLVWSRDCRVRDEGYLLSRSKVGEEGGLSSSRSTTKRRRRLSESREVLMVVVPFVSAADGRDVEGVGGGLDLEVEGSGAGGHCAGRERRRVGGLVVVEWRTVGSSGCLVPYWRRETKQSRIYRALMTVDVSGKLEAAVHFSSLGPVHYP
jgi:hypothetical protein